MNEPTKQELKSRVAFLEAENHRLELSLDARPKDEKDALAKTAELEAQVAELEAQVAELERQEANSNAELSPEIAGDPALAWDAKRGIVEQRRLAERRRKQEEKQRQRAVVAPGL